MFIEDEKIKIKWNPANKKHYLSLGYKFTQFGDELEVTAKDLTKTSSGIITAICDYCDELFKIEKYKYDQKITRSPNGKITCSDPKCTYKKNEEIRYLDNRKKQYLQYLDKCHQKGYVPLSTLEDHHGVHSECKYKCLIHGVMKTTWANFLREDNNGCKLCSAQIAGQKMSLSPDEVKVIVESKNNNILVNPEDYINMHTKNLKIICGICKNMFISSLASISNSKGYCYKCGIAINSSVRRYSQDEVKDIIEKINNNIWLNYGEYNNYAKVNLNIMCGCCKENMFITSLSNYVFFNKTRCDICTQRTSSGEIIIMNILDQLGLQYETEHTFDDCKDKRCLPFDFYLPQNNICIEFDGQGHYEPVYSEYSYKQTVKHDKIKDEYCRDNGIKLIRIPYWEANQAEQIIKDNI